MRACPMSSSHSKVEWGLQEPVLWYPFDQVSIYPTLTCQFFLFFVFERENSPTLACPVWQALMGIWDFLLLIRPTSKRMVNRARSRRSIHRSLNDSSSSSSSSSSGACNMTMLFDLNGSQVVVQLLVGRGALIQTNNTLLLLFSVVVVPCNLLERMKTQEEPVSFQVRRWEGGCSDKEWSWGR